MIPSSASVANHRIMIGPKKYSHAGGAVLLHDEQQKQHNERQRHNIRFERRVADFQSSIADSTEIAGVITLSP